MSFLFLSCHFPAKPVAKRRACYQVMCQKILQTFKLPDYGLRGIYNHIVWVGDLNYRLNDLEVPECEKLLDRVSVAKMTSSWTSSRF